MAIDTDYSGVWLIIPAYNEAQVISSVVEGVTRWIDPSRIIVVDDGSTDQTSYLATKAGVHLLRHVINRGQGAALATGIQVALQHGAQVIVTFDADGQHDPTDLPTLIKPIQSGLSDVVLGTRFAADCASSIPLTRRLLLKTAVWFTRLLTGLHVTDVHNGLRVLSNRAASQLRIRQDRMEHASEIFDEIKRNRLTYTERPTRIRYSQYSIDKGQKNRDALRLALRIILKKVGG